MGNSPVQPLSGLETSFKEQNDCRDEKNHEEKSHSDSETEQKTEEGSLEEGNNPSRDSEDCTHEKADYSGATHDNCRQLDS